MKIACIGSRNITQKAALMCQAIGKILVEQGHTIHSGNCRGADQAFASGGNCVDPSKVHLFLPWPDYEINHIHTLNIVSPGPDQHHFEVAAKHRSGFYGYRRCAKLLLARNVQIIEGVDKVVGIPTSPHGGTRFTMRVAVTLGIDVIAITQNMDETDAAAIYDIFIMGEDF